MDIPRPANSFVLIAVLPALFIHTFHVEGEDSTFVLVIVVGLIVMFLALLFQYGLYMRRTPLVRIDDTSLTFFGNAKSQQRSFPRQAISRISLSSRPHFWRSSFRFSILADEKTVDLWIPHASASSVSALACALRDEFPGKFEHGRI